MVSVYKPSPQDGTYFLNWLSQILDFCSTSYEKQVIIEDFNLNPDNKRMRKFLDLYNLINLIKTTSYFKGTGSWILLTNQKYTFRNTNAFEAGLSDHHLLIC